MDFIYLASGFSHLWVSYYLNWNYVESGLIALKFHTRTLVRTAYRVCKQYRGNSWFCFKQTKFALTAVFLLFFYFCFLSYFGAIITTWKSNQNGKKSIHTCVRKKQQQVKGTKCKYCQQRQQQQQLRGENEAKVNENCNNNNNNNAFNSVAAATKTTTTTTTAARMGGYRRRLRRQRWRRAPTHNHNTHTHALHTKMNSFVFFLIHFCWLLFCLLDLQYT